MKISELKPRQNNVEIEGIIKEMGEPRTFNKFGKELSVTNAILGDDSGTIKLTLWNEDIDRFKEGDNIKIVNGFVNEFQGEAQLTSGKFGRIDKVGEGSETTSSNLKSKTTKKPNKKIEDFEEIDESEEKTDSEESKDIEEVEY